MRICLDIPWLLHRFVQIFLGSATGVTFLGFIVDSTLCAFLIPEVKKKKFVDLRESILKGRSVSVKTLQRFDGKITSFSIAVPLAQLYAREIYRAISGYSKSSRLVKITGTLRKELQHWRFLDTWRDCLPWPRESHFIVKCLLMRPILHGLGLSRFQTSPQSQSVMTG